MTGKWYWRAAGAWLTVVAWTALPAAAAQQPRAGAEFEDPVAGVTMVVVPAGRFTIGSPAEEAGRSEHESPQKAVAFARPFAVSKTEVTVGQFRAFVEATGYVTVAENAGKSKVMNIHKGRIVEREGVNWRHGYRGEDADDGDPVVHVAWDDAVAYVSWLAAQTGQPYRLPSEAEFEYALRAGTTTRYWWGEASPSRAVENLAGSRDRERGSDVRWPAGFRNYTDRHWGLAPAGKFAANPFGLKDMGGNAAEWVADCYRESLAEVPQDGGVNDGECGLRVMRGASWANPPPMSRSAFRMGRESGATSALVGFRVARDLTDALVSDAAQ